MMLNRIRPDSYVWAFLGFLWISQMLPARKKACMRGSFSLILVSRVVYPYLL